MTLITETIISGFISEIFNNCSEITKTKIKNMVENGNPKHQNLEGQIYNIIVCVLNKITNDQYKNNQDKIYDVADNLLNSLKSNKNNNIENLRTGLQEFCSCFNNNNIYKNFIELFCEEISKNEYNELYHEIRLLQTEQQSSKISEIEHKINVVDNKIEQHFNEVNQKLIDIKRDDENINIKNKGTQQIIKSRTKEYANKWNENMFLNNFNEWDENAGTNIKLREVYGENNLPHFIWKKNNSKFDTLKILLSTYTVENYEKKMLLILGQPGIGKSTLITWIASNFNTYIDNILVYQFALDLKNIDWKNTSTNYNISDEICKTLNLSYNDLNGKTLIFDGFDEISVGNERAKILNLLYWKLIKESSMNKFSLIITCRENYIEKIDNVDCDYITLQPWDSNQIQNFCQNYQAKINGCLSENTMENILSNKTILGIPLILYMVMALNISTNKESSIATIYDQIFSINGGIYERCLQNKRYEIPHRINEIKEQIHQVSKDIALWMFENNPEEAYIPREEYEKICTKVMKEHIQGNEEKKYDFLIGNYFKRVRHCEETESEKLYFIHRSIYEYFVAETIYHSIENTIRNPTDEIHVELARNLAIYLKQGILTKTIGEYLQYKIFKLSNHFDDNKKENFYQWLETTVKKMIEVGMFYYTKMNIQNYSNIILKESCCFINLLKMLRLLLMLSKRKYIMENVNIKFLEKYIKLCCIEYDTYGMNFSRLFLKEINLKSMELIKINLSCTDLSIARLSQANLYLADLNGANLSSADLQMANLLKANLIKADLHKANLQRADLSRADLSRADLSRANLQRADLSRADLSRANLNQANLQRADLSRADLSKANLQGADLRYAKLNQANLSQANLQGADLRYTNLNQANLQGADLQGTILQE